MKFNNHFIAALIDTLEDYLETHDVQNNPERREDPDAALIYGTDYDELNDELKSFMNEWGIEIEDNWN